MLQCSKCGGRTILTTRTGAFIKKGRITGGTITDKNVCAICYRRGIHSPMLPELVVID
jgi:hypothetical protein